MLPASPAIAGARREPDPLHRLLTVIGRRACFLLFARPQLFTAMLLLLQSAQCTLTIEERALSTFQQSKGKPMACCGDAKTSCASVEFYAQSCATLCKPVMGVARADGLYISIVIWASCHTLADTC